MPAEPAQIESSGLQIARELSEPIRFCLIGILAVSLVGMTVSLDCWGAEGQPASLPQFSRLTQRAESAPFVQTPIPLTPQPIIASQAVRSVLPLEVAQVTQTDRVDDPVVGAEASSAEAEHNIERDATEAGPNYSLSAALPRSRELDLLGERVQHAWQQQEQATLVQALQLLLEDDSQSFLRVGETFYPPHAYARHLLLQLDQSSLQAYLRQTTTQADTLLQSILAEGDLDRLPEVARRFPFTPAARRGTWMWIAARRDRGEEQAGQSLLAAAWETYQRTGVAELDPARLEPLMKQSAPADNNPPSTVLSSLTWTDELPRQLHTQPLWRQPVDIAPAALDLVERGVRDLLESGVTPLPHWQALFTDELLISQGPLQWEARRLSDGALVWQRPAPQYGARLFQSLSSTDNLLRLWQVSQLLLHRLFGESLYATAVLDAQALFFIEPVEFPRENARTQDTGDSERLPVPNRLVCVDPLTGAQRWTHDSVAIKTASLEPGHFCSPPAVWESELLVTYEYQASQQLSLLAFDRTDGRFLREIPLAKTAKPLSSSLFADRDGRRAALACPIRISGTLAYCATGAGIVAAIDLARSQVDWVFRYPRDDGLHSGTGFLHPELGETGFQWWQGWQGVQLQIYDDHLAIASPEWEQLAVLDRASGRLLWSVPREDGLYLITGQKQDRQLVVIGRNSARSYELQTGEVRWQSALNLPTGFGARLHNACLIPDSDDGWLALDWQTGQQLASPFNLDPRWTFTSHAEPRDQRNFAIHQNRLYELRLNSILARELPSPETTGTPQAIAQTPAADAPPKATSLRDRVLQLLATDKLQAAWETYFAAAPVSTEARPLVKLLIQAQAQHRQNQQEVSSTSALPASDSFDPYLVLHDQEGLQSWFRFELQQALRTRNWTALQDLLQRRWTRTFAGALITERLRRARLDHWLAMELQSLVTRLNDEHPNEVQQLKTALQAALTALVLDAPTEAARLQQWQQLLPWPDLIDPELAFAELSPTADPREREQQALAIVLQKLTQIEKQSPGAASTSPTASAFLSSETERKPSWPNSTPVVTGRPRLSGNVYFEPVPIRNLDGTPHLELNVEIEYPGHRGIRLSSAASGRPWHYYLPETYRTLRMDRELVQGWMIGRLLVLQVGSEVFGLSPVDQTGRRAATHLWPPAGETIDTLGDRSNHRLAFQTVNLPERPGYPRLPARRLDAFAQHAAEVGPVRAGYFCIQQKGMLVAYETLTGEEIWRRYDLPQEAVCLGDEDTVLVTSYRSRSAQLLSAVDGRVLRTLKLTMHPEDILQTSGLYVLVQQGGATRTPVPVASAADEPSPLRLRWLNLATGTTLWERSWSAEAIPFELDTRWTGIWDPDGQLEIFETATGKTIRTHPFSNAEPVVNILCSAGQGQLVVVFSQRVTDERLLNSTQISGGYRRSLVEGNMFGIDHQSAELLWQRPLESSVFRLDQPVDLPVFATASIRAEETADSQPPANTIPGSRVTLYSRLTGEQLYQSSISSPQVMYQLNGDQQQQRVTLTTRHQLTDLHFSTPVENQPKDDER